MRKFRVKYSKKIKLDRSTYQMCHYYFTKKPFSTALYYFIVCQNRFHYFSEFGQLLRYRQFYLKCAVTLSLTETTASQIIT